MSLLLDALKKAAEQKAAKGKNEESGSDTGSADETALDVTAREARDSDADDGSIPRHRLEDETELDHSEYDTRLERTRTGFEDRTESEYGPADDTGARTPSPPEQINSGEDETLVFAEDDFTELTELMEGPSGDQTQFTQRELPEDETEVTRQPPDPGQTEVTEGPSGDQTQLTQRELPGDETEFTQQPPDPGQTDFTEGTLSEDRTDFTQNAASEAESNLTQTEYDETTGIDDDMSLLLVEREQTQLTSPTSITDPQHPQDAFRALGNESPASDEATQADPTQTRADEDRTAGTDTTLTQTRSGQTSTTAPASVTQQTTRATLSRTDATATHTYAPDNYDRTLMRLPNDDASKLFAGMKSDSDVVMTPDYAKQVFRSKSSAQRVQHYKAYVGIALVILLAIGVYGVFEYQSESEVIDSSLRPLKNDPMPGIIRSANVEKNADPIFAENEINKRALEIIQNLEEGEPGAEKPDADSDADADAESSPPVESVAVAAADMLPTEQSAAAVADPIPQQPAENSRAGQATAAGRRGGDEIAMSEGGDNRTIFGDVSVPPAETTSSSISGLQIRSGKRIEEKQLLLREAYDAYRSGNDELALQRYNQVLAIDPGNRDALLARAAIRVQNDDVSTAIEDYQALLLANPKDSQAMASLIAVANYSPAATVTQLKLMMRDEPESPHLNFALANVYGAQNRWQEAQGHYYRALQNNPDDPNYAYNLAVSLEHISQPRAAVSYYRRALENYSKGLAIFSREVVDRRLEKLTQQ